VPGTRLLIIADPKMLPALANGLRDGGKFDVIAVPLTDVAAAKVAAESADAVALFYGAPDKPLPAALQALAPKVRDRGARLVAVLQRDQAAQRDECFRAGASDLLFMPMPKEQFVSRLLGSIGLSWAPEGGAPAPVSVATRTLTTQVEAAAITPAGVEAPGDLPLKAGETVRLSWGTFQTWGLVVRGGPSAQIRFAGLAPDEEGQIREWLKSPAPTVPAPTVPAPTVPAPTVPAPTVPAPTVPAPIVPAPIVPAPTVPAPAAAAAPEARAAPSAGPPPGFADRKPIRPQTPTRPPTRIPSPAMPAPATAPAKNGPEKDFPTPPMGTPIAPSPAPAPPPAAAPTSAADPSALASLFGNAPPAPGAAPSPGSAASTASPSGPPWPVPVPAAACKATALQLLGSKTLPPDTPPQIGASARKIAGGLGSAERAALDKAGPDSVLADALAARIALDAATTEGVRLYSVIPAPVFDQAAATSLTQLADAAAARLQQQANAAIGKGEVETLQLVTAASAALSRDLLAYKEIADRLRGMGSSPGLGARSLDPDFILPGQQPRPAAARSSTPAPVRAELRDFAALDDSRPGSGKKIALIVAAALFVAGVANAYFFALPRRMQIDPASAGPNVVRIDVSGDAALVVVTQAWINSYETELPLLVNVLHGQGVERALLVFPSGKSAGTVDVTKGKALGIVRPPK
jgi:hypothetical protein